MSTPALFQENAKNYYRLVHGIDDAVGQIRKKLTSLGLEKNTIIVYTSDHSFSLGEHGIMGKWHGFEEAIRVPLIIYNPLDNTQKGIKSDRMALNIDIGPTILNLASVKVPTAMQGVNLGDLLTNKVAERSRFFYQHTVFSSPMLPKVEGIVAKDLKYMRYIENGYEELYDTKTDPKEITNLAKNPSYDARLNESRTLYKNEKVASK